MKNLDEEIINLMSHNSPAELALGYARYEKLRTLTINQYKTLCERNLHGENFDEMIDDMINEENCGNNEY